MFFARIDNHPPTASHLNRLLILILLLAVPIMSSGQRVSVSNGNDLMSLGAGARNLSMGGTGVAFVNDITASFWNPAGLARITSGQAGYMHSERFSGLVSYDFGAVAFPVEDADAVVGISFFRQAVDNIKNTTNAWDRDRGLPYPDATERFELFSASDMAFLVTFAKEGTVQWGVNAKILYSKLGAFANAWGYSLDAGIQGGSGSFKWGVSLIDATTLSKFWTVNASAFADREANFDEAVPVGQNEKTLPSLRTGLAYQQRFGKFKVLAAGELVARVDGTSAYYLSAGPVVYEPHFGLEINAFNVMSIRSGLTNFYRSAEGSLNPSPTIGAGLDFNHLSLDYSFDNFQGVSSMFGNTHRISIVYRFNSSK